MRLVIPLCLLSLILGIKAQIPLDCITSPTNRPPENEDISVTCGTDYVELAIYICPMYQALYNESLMVLNGQSSTPECFGTADWTVTPPVLRFRFPLNESALTACGNGFKIFNRTGTGYYSDYSMIQFVNISGIINSIDPSQTMITYRPQILYMFSCLYPLQYLLNNTRLDVSGVNLAINDNNGSFVSTLDIAFYENEQRTNIMFIPVTGLRLKTKIYVAVIATDLTKRFNVLLDRCYATTTSYPDYDTYYDLFVGCNRDAQTQMELNGVAQHAYFSFEAFRFVEHSNRTVSTFYLHCVVRLCEVSQCSSLLPDCSAAQKRRKREAGDGYPNATITSKAIYVGEKSVEDGQTFSVPYSTNNESNYSSPVVGVIVCIVILAVLLVAMGGYFVFYTRRIKPALQ
ncbi:zona pellucida-like domain-containing protein 1 [Cheilinus undulatus]|uniref:zona pellucida-like domain-containing protein 1 n=1 Tax=Cheilinus undulatus TaxID=241271 RepID=UPI001BD6A35B|nr:zona pellucida-like domain-containing protein 1 [Cheilinus undulatus]